MPENEIVGLGVNELVGALMQEEVSRQPHKAGGKSQALMAARTTGKQNKKAGSKGGNTPWNKQKGGDKNSQVGSSSTKKREGSCNWCGLPNHWERECCKKKAGEPHKAPVPEANTVTKREKTTPSALVVELVEMGGQHIERQELEHAKRDLVDYALTVCLSVANNRDGWYLDSGATAHICQKAKFFCDYTAADSEQRVSLGDNTQLQVKGTGTVRFDLGKGKSFELKGVLHVPGISKNLMSVAQLAKGGKYQIQFAERTCQVKQGDEVQLHGELVDELYLLQGITSLGIGLLVTSAATQTDVDTWHSRLGHPNKGKLSRILAGDMYDGGVPHNTNRTPSECEHCVFAKHHVSSFPKQSQSRGKENLELIHFDVCGPVSTKSLGEGRYFLMFIDDHSRYGWIEILKTKNEALQIFQEFVIKIERQSGEKLRSLHTDNGDEFDSTEFNSYCKSLGISRQFTVPYSPA